MTARPSGAADTGAPPAVTVVIPARNEQDAIASCLASVTAQTFRDVEFLVVDGASEDATRAIVDEWRARDPRIRLIDNPDRRIPAALNRALQAARGRWLVRVDAHAQIPVDYIARVVAHLETERWGGVGGRKDGVGRTPAGVAIAAAMASRFAGGSTYHHGTESTTVGHIPFGAYPVALARELGGWDERLLVNQDYEFDYRLGQAGHELLFDPELRIDWESRQSLPAVFRQYRRYGAGKVDVLAIHPGSLEIRHLAAPALIGLLVLALAVAIVSRRLAAMLLAPYGLAVAAGTATTIGEVSGWRARAAVPGAFAAMHIGYGLGFWQAALALLRARPTAPPVTVPSALVDRERVAR